MIEAFPCAKTTTIVSQITGVPFDDIRGRSRSREIVRARQITMYLAKRVRGLSYSAVGRAFKRDHSTVIHAVKLIEKLIEASPECAALVATCRSQVEDSMQDRKITDVSKLPLRITTSQVLDLAGISIPTLRKRILEGTMPREVDKGHERLFDRDAVLRALGLLPDAAPVQEVASW